MRKVRCIAQMAAIVGQSGSGKSTLIKTISGLYDTTEEDILINEINIKNIKTDCPPFFY